MTESPFDCAAAPELPWAGSPPPQTAATLLNVPEMVAGMLTVSLMVLLAPPARFGVAVQVMVVVPMQLHTLPAEV